jgi:hypothetical protein
MYGASAEQSHPCMDGMHTTSTRADKAPDTHFPFCTYKDRISVFVWNGMRRFRKSGVHRAYQAQLRGCTHRHNAANGAPLFADSASGGRY